MVRFVTSADGSSSADISYCETSLSYPTPTLRLRPGVTRYACNTHTYTRARMPQCIFVYLSSRAEMHCSLTHSQGIHTLNMYAVRTTTVARMRLKLLCVTAPYGNQHARNIVAGCGNESSRFVSARNLPEDVYEGTGDARMYVRVYAASRFGPF